MVKAYFTASPSDMGVRMQTARKLPCGRFNLLQPTGEPAKQYYLANILAVCRTVCQIPYASGIPTITQEPISLPVEVGFSTRS